MKSVLEMHYPGGKMHLICKTCRGNAEWYLKRFKCPLCKKNLLDYKKEGLENEAVEFRYLHNTWLKLQGFNQPTTGIKKLDSLLELLFGKPHNNDWRNYKKFPVRETSPHVILRTVNIGRGTDDEPEPIESVP